ncbi:hypothetical protein [Salinimicrobium oceani]|uniref:Outer membrane protein beta-barrel domain-containing protein n=1 Tax=Salinimicrobium oceani TaxID=2722702 RepID=A0ABX1D0Q8_9FLAO|nr:hypothetical protein [Salinimicrobium oceani]NJW54102.1 hypothetical protein [Salinimicrobium oceani]
MKKFTFLVLLCLSSFVINPAIAQEKTNKEKIEQLEKQREQIINEEKAALKKEVEAINKRAEAREIDWEEAEKLKSEAARKHALNIQNRVAIIDNQIALLVREEGAEEWSWEEEEEEDEEDHDHWFNKSRYSRTSTHMVMAVGFNNALTEGQSLNDSDFKVGGSRFFELGIAWRTRVFERSNFMRLRYGFSFQFNGLKPTNNRYFVEDEALTVLETYPIELDKSKFRMDNLVFPLHFEFGPSKKVESDRSVWFSTHDKLKIGLGGYAGVNLGERQKLKYEADGENVKEKLKGDYNTNDFIYGLSGYIGFGGTSLYVKYDLNPIFKDPNPQMHNLSVGLRFDAN